MKKVSQEFVDKLAALGYTEEQSRRALEVAEGNVDDAIDFLVSNGAKVNRASAEPKKNSIIAGDDNTVAVSTNPQKNCSETKAGASAKKKDNAETDDEVSVMTESSLQTQQASNVTKPPATSSLSHMAMRQVISKAKPSAPNMASRLLSLTEISETEDISSRPDAEITVDTGLPMDLNKDNQAMQSPTLEFPDSNGMVNDNSDTTKSETIADTDTRPSKVPVATQHHRQVNNVSRRPNTTSRPGAFPMTGRPIALRQLHNRTAESQEPQPTGTNQVESRSSSGS